MNQNKKNRVQFLIRFGYQGSRFHGVQPQPDVITAGEALKRRLRAALPEKPRGLVYAARTDSQVSALANYATCWYANIEDEKCFRDLVETDRDDGLLGVTLTRVPYFVHARGISTGKRYRYWVETGYEEACRDNQYVWQIVPKLHKDRLERAARDLLGTHDFSAFRASGCSAGTTIKKLSRVLIGGPFPVGDGLERWVFEFEGDAFLRKMIRIMVGTLVEIGTYWRSQNDIPRIIKEGHRNAAGVTAPACGLTLSQVGANWPEDKSNHVFASKPFSKSKIVTDTAS